MTAAEHGMGEGVARISLAGKRRYVINRETAGRQQANATQQKVGGSDASMERRVREWRRIDRCPGAGSGS
eukprot:15485419-Alexandrium_andersonii.AAC.1